MLSRSQVEQIKCRWREFRREPSAFFWVLFMPLMWMVILGFAFSHPHAETYGLGYLAEPGAPAALVRNVENVVKTDAQIKVTPGTLSDYEIKMKRGEIALILTAGADGKVHYRYDSHNPESIRAQQYVDNKIQRAAGRQDLVQNETQEMNVEGGRYIDFLIPGLLGLSLMSTSLFGVGMTIVSNRSNNMLKRYAATPMDPSEYILSYIYGRVLTMAAEMAMILISGFIIFRFRIYGNFLSFLLFAVLGAAAFTSISMLCAVRSKSIPFISGVTNIISLGMTMLSGVFFSRSNFPAWLVHATDYLPLTALNQGLRRVALEGLPLSALTFELAVLAFYIVVPAVLTQRLFKWY